MFLFEKKWLRRCILKRKRANKWLFRGLVMSIRIDENKALEFPIKQAESDIHIGIYHGDTSRKAQQNYAPFTWKDLKATGYNYWALNIHSSAANC